MIRKVALIIVVSAIALWVLGAHYVKSRVLDFIDQINSDNLKFQYENTKLSGFPFNWKVTFVAPKITFIDQASLKEIATESFSVTSNYLGNNLKVILDKSFTFNEADETTAGSYTYNLSKISEVNINLGESIYFSKADDQFWDRIRSFEYSNTQISVQYDGKEIYIINDLKFSLNQEKKIESVVSQFSISANFSSAQENPDVKNGYMNFSGSYYQAEDEKIDFERKLDIANLQLKLDEALLDLKGVIKLSKSTTPSGKLDVMMQKYPDLVDILLPEEFFVSKSFLIKSIDRIVASEVMKGEIGNASFKIIFSDKGINFGKLSLSELQDE